MHIPQTVRVEVRRRKKNFIYRKLIRQIIRHIAKISMEGCRKARAIAHRSRPPIVSTQKILIAVISNNRKHTHTHTKY